MRIAVIGANTSCGNKIVLKAESQGIKVTSIVNSFSDVVGNGKLIVKDYDDITFEDVKDCHYIVDALSFLEITRFSSDVLPVWHLLEILKNSPVRLLELGSAAFLYTDKSRQKLVVESDSVILDDKQNKTDRLCVNAYKRLSSCLNVDWSVLCPPLLLDEYSYGSGEYEFSDNILPVGLNGDSFISLNDYITACIELLKLNPKKHSCVSVRGTRLK